MRLWATRESRSELMLAGLRILMGAIFLAVWSDNLIKGYYTPDGWADFVQQYADTTKVGIYGRVLNDVLIPNAALFAYGQLGIELVVFGLFLLLGVFTPVAGLLAAGFQLNLLVATSGIPTEWPGTYILMFALCLTVALGQAGRTLGVDAQVREEEPAPAGAHLLSGRVATRGTGQRRQGPGRKPNSRRRKRHQKMSQTAPSVPRQVPAILERPARGR